MKMDLLLLFLGTEDALKSAHEQLIFKNLAWGYTPNPRFKGQEGIGREGGERMEGEERREEVSALSQKKSWPRLWEGREEGGSEGRGRDERRGERRNRGENAKYTE
jgi:hypothetical protein